MRDAKVRAPPAPFTFILYGGGGASASPAPESRPRAPKRFRRV
ncbi:MAG TPA: hypothetical protein VK669_07080 [Candidatus Limnocylindrales bacterium]|nr:hypothetical protein [Candidatus Limnocylindrales bacterium]